LYRWARHEPMAHHGERHLPLCMEIPHGFEEKTAISDKRVAVRETDGRRSGGPCHSRGARAEFAVPRTRRGFYSPP